MNPTFAQTRHLAERRRARGLTTVEYAIAGALMTAGIVFAFANLGDSVAFRITELASLVGGDGPNSAVMGGGGSTPETGGEPGQTGPGNSGNAPGHGGGRPGKSAGAPGKNKKP